MILYFTGTGNSRYLANHIAAALDDECVNAADFMREHKAAHLASDKPYVIVYPTYAYRMPHVFEAFLRKSTLSGNKRVYFVMTCGADTGNAASHVANLCETKGWDYMGLLPVVMPDNYVVMYTVTEKEAEAGIIEKATVEVDQAVELIRRNARFAELPIGVLDRLKSGPINPIFYKAMVKTKKFYATDACVSCGKCAKVCPLGNVTIVSGKPQWGGDCTHCMACISACPKTAIEYGKATKGRRRYYLD